MPVTAVVGAQYGDEGKGRIVDYLAGQSARRCGPCFNGLPALASALRGVSLGGGDLARVEQLSEIVVRRGACAHPDGTVRLVQSLLAGFGDELDSHAAGVCTHRTVRAVRTEEAS